MFIPISILVYTLILVSLYTHSDTTILTPHSDTTILTPHSHTTIPSSFPYHHYTLVPIPAGPIPTGHRYAAKSQSDQTHMLPVSGFEAAESDYRMLLSEIQSFTSTTMGPRPGEPLVFAKVSVRDAL